MAVPEAKILEASLRANRRALELLDQQIAEVSRIHPSATDDLERARQSLPFSYVVDFTGAPATNAAGTPVSGYVRVDSDSSFILDGIHVDQQPRPLGGSTSGRRSINTWLLEMKITDVSNGREIVLLGRDDRAAQTGLVSPAGLALQSLVVWNQLSRGRVRLPAETTFPRNAQLRVDLFARLAINFTSPDFSTFTIPRNFIVLTGTKVFGG